MPERRAGCHGAGAAGHRAGAEALRLLIRPSGGFQAHPSASGAGFFDVFFDGQGLRDKTDLLNRFNKIYLTGKSLLFIRIESQASESKIFLFFGNRNQGI